MLKEAAYGLPELHREEIKSAKLSLAPAAWQHRQSLA